MSVLFWNKLPKKIPLLIVLVTSFVTLNVLAVGLVGYLSFRNGQSAVNDVAGQLRSEITTRIEAHLYTFLNIPHQINQANANILRQGVLVANDAPTLKHYFWEQIQIFDSVSSIYFGNTAGGLVDAGREGAGGFLYVISTDGFVSGPLKKYATDSQGQWTDLLVTVPDFDARTRPWYRGAVNKGDLVWNEPYILFTGQDIAIAASRPVYNEQQELLGVVSVDVFLSQLNSFLQSSNIGETGQAFIMERSGLLVASSAAEKPFTVPGGSEAQRRLYATESVNPLISQAAEALAEEFGDYRHIAETQQLEFEIDENRQFLQVSPIENKNGLDWLVVVVIPEADFMAQINANNRLTIYLIIITLLITVVISVIAARKIIGPILQLNTSAHALSKGEWGQTISHDIRISEISALARSFSQMSGQIQQMIADLTTEVTERKQAELRLAAEKERLAVTLNSIGDAVIATDINGNVTGINPVAKTLTGWKEKEAVDKPLADVFHIINEKTGEPVENPVTKVLKSGKIIGLANHTALIARDGTRRSIADSGAPILDGQGKIIGVVLVFRDVTQEKKREEEQIKIKKLESVGVLAGGIAHDFNNILAAILGNISLADMYIEKENKAHPLLKEAEKASIRAKDLTQQLLTFSKGGDPVRETTSIKQVITDSADFVLHGSNVRCRYAIPEDLWMVDIDTGQISQVIQNIAINARHAMPEGGEIKISCENIADITTEIGLSLPGEKYIKITIADTGGGIPEKYLDKIFDPYFSTKQQGSGLGLAVTHSIINKHDGHIFVRSKSGEGTTFTIYLPASAEQISSDAGEEAKQPEKTVKGTILVMDDEQMIQDLAKQMLSLFGHEVLQAKDGEEAIAIFKEHRDSDNPVDVIIMDLTIPGGMGGKDAIEEILKIDPDAKAIVSSGYSNDPVMANYRQYGFKASIGKPFEMAQLKETVNSVLG